MPITRMTLEPQAGNQQYDVLRYHVSWDQSVHTKTGEPSGEPEIESLTVIIARDSEKDDSFFCKWQFDSTRTEDAFICFYDQKRLIRKMPIKQAFLVGYAQECDDPGEIRETLEMSPTEIVLDGVAYKRKK